MSTAAEACTASGLSRARSAPTPAPPRRTTGRRLGPAPSRGRTRPVGRDGHRSRAPETRLTGHRRAARGATRRSRLRRGAGLPSRSTGRRGSSLVRGGVTPGGLLRSAPARRPRPRGAIRRWMAWTSRAGRPPAGRRRSSRRLASHRDNISTAYRIPCLEAGGPVSAWSTPGHRPSGRGRGRAGRAYASLRDARPLLVARARRRSTRDASPCAVVSTPRAGRAGALQPIVVASRLRRGGAGMPTAKERAEASWPPSRPARRSSA